VAIQEFGDSKTAALRACAARQVVPLRAANGWKTVRWFATGAGDRTVRDGRLRAGKASAGEEGQDGEEEGR
jgi:hypothetical protein